MLVSMLVASDDATAGSVIRKAERISPFISGRSHFCLCSLEPYRISTSMLPVSGAGRVRELLGARGPLPRLALGILLLVDRPRVPDMLVHERLHPVQPCVLA